MTSMNKEKYNLFNIEYETWHDICQIYFSNEKISKKLQTSYLQWFPLSKLSEEEIAYLSSESFFDKYIKNGAFFLFEKSRLRMKNYITKNDGSFRDATLVSPILFLVLQTIGKKISKLYTINRKDNIDVFYGGNYKLLQPYYKNEYKDFLNCIDENSVNYKYFIKTDLSSFFKSIDVNMLIEKIDRQCNNKFDPSNLLFLKEFLLYCGNNKFPLIENSVASSFLSTVVYLDDIDSKMENEIIPNIPQITKFKLIRYVDDLYILFTCDEKDKSHIYNQIISEYSSLLKESHLSLNSKKCLLGLTKNIDDVIKKSLYDDEFNNLDSLDDILSYDLFNKFLVELIKSNDNNSLVYKKYYELIDSAFENASNNLAPSEVYNYFIYSKNDIPEKSKTKIINSLTTLFEKNPAFIDFDPKRLTILIIKTKDESLIKKLLNRLLTKGSKEILNSYDIISSLTYLMQTKFSHNALIQILSEQIPEFKNYYLDYCHNSFMKIFNDKMVNQYIDVIDEQVIPYYLYYLYVIEDGRFNNLNKYRYYKNFFISYTACLERKIKKTSTPRYDDFKKDSSLISFYKSIDNSSKIIEETFTNKNIDNNIVSLSLKKKEINKSISDLKKLIKEITSSKYN